MERGRGARVRETERKCTMVDGDEILFQDKRKQAKMELIFRFEQTSGCK